MMRQRIFLVVFLLAAASVAWAQPVRVTSPLSKHNLSVSGPGPVKAVTMTEICVFCHTPHNSLPEVPLWNQQLSSGVTYTPYASSTMAAAVGAPTGSSKLCLSCHDGTVAVASTAAKGRITMQSAPTRLDAQGRLIGPSTLGTNLADDHPVSFVPITGSQIVLPPAGDPVKLDAGGMLQCRSCHDPHTQNNDPVTNKFLVKSNSASGLCLTCHVKQYWATNPSTHRTSTKTYTAAQGSHNGYTTVATAACEACHKPHTATTAQRVLKGQEETTCGTGAGAQCHGSSGVASKNIAAEFNKTYRHPTYSVTPSVHNAAESPTNPSYRLPETLAGTARHAECFDCHNPHASYAATATRPKGSGKLSGVWGINSGGVRVDPSGTPPSVNEYEICYKCHGDSANKPQPTGPYAPYSNRQIVQWNKRLQFQTTNPSFHPIAGNKSATDSMPSLLAPWTTSSIIYCTDCHDNDTGPKAPTPGTGPSGPHGSQWKHLLVARYEKDVYEVVESAAVYALCYKCHSQSSILNDDSFRHHRRHLRKDISCSKCHDPHGISGTQGNSVNNNHLINFDRRWVTPDDQGRLRFEDLGNRTGRCYLNCHGKRHDPETY